MPLELLYRNSVVWWSRLHKCAINLPEFPTKLIFLWLQSQLSWNLLPSLPLARCSCSPLGSLAPHRGEAGTGQLSARLRTSAWWEWCQFWLFFQAGPAYRVCSEKSRLQFIFSHSWILWNSCWFRPRLQDGTAARNGNVVPFAFKRVLCSHRSTITTDNTAVSTPGQ